MGIDWGYRPRAEFISFHKRSERWACLVAHRRAGKTLACVADLVRRATLEKRRHCRYAYVAPYYVQAKDVVWSYLKRFTGRIRGAQFNEAELRVDLPRNGSRIRLYGADNYDRLRGIYLDGVILDEYADMPPAAWTEVIRPALADRQGFAVFIGTPKGRNGFHDVWQKAQASPKWFTLMLKASETGLLPPGELDAARAEMSPESFDQEFECSFDAAIVGAYWGKELAEAQRLGHIANVPVDPTLPVHTAWDLGIGDSTAIWFFQVVGQEVRVVDFYENHGQGLPHYASVLAARRYRYGDDWVPHDAKVRELGTGRTRVETLISLGRKPRLVPQHKLEDGINAVRQTIPRMWFDAVRCRDGVEALRQYRSEYDEKRKVFTDKPLHDYTSHAADSCRYMCMSYRELAPPPPPPKTYDFQNQSITDLVGDITKARPRPKVTA